MQLDTRAFKFVKREQWSLLSAIEKGMHQYEYVPKAQLCHMAKLRPSGIHDLLGDLMQYGLVAYERKEAYEGYRLTWKAFDYLAINALIKMGKIGSIGPRIGVGKEADVHIGRDGGKNVAIKFHRLGRTSFRTVTTNREYLKKGEQTKGWIHLSIRSAESEFAALEKLRDLGMPIPAPIGHNRHCIVMEFAEGILLNKCHNLEVEQIDSLVERLFDVLFAFAVSGLIHGDFNEFNIIIKDQDLDSENAVCVIDFPQVIQIDNPMAQELFERDVKGIITFFKKRFNYVIHDSPTWEDVLEGTDFEFKNSNPNNEDSRDSDSDSTGEAQYESKLLSDQPAETS